MDNTRQLMVSVPNTQIQPQYYDTRRELSEALGLSIQILDRKIKGQQLFATPSDPQTKILVQWTYTPPRVGNPVYTTRDGVVEKHETTKSCANALGVTRTVLKHRIRNNLPIGEYTVSHTQGMQPQGNPPQCLRKQVHATDRDGVTTTYGSIAKCVRALGYTNMFLSKRVSSGNNTITSKDGKHTYTLSM